MGMEPSDLKKRIEHAIREGAGQKYLDLVNGLKNTYYPEDVAAAAIALYARQEGQQEQRVRRRTLDNATPVSKPAEAKGQEEKKKSVLPPARPIAVRKEHNVPGGHGRNPVAEGQGGRTGQPRHNHPGKGQSRSNQPGAGQPRGGQSRSNQPAKSRRR